MYDFRQSDYVLTLILINESYSLVLKLVYLGHHEPIVFLDLANRGYTLSTPGLDWSKKPPLSGLRSTTRWGDALALAGLVEGPSRLVDALGVVHVELRVLSLSVEEGICLPLTVWQESWPNFKGLPKVSEVTTNHWVLLRCDWSPVSS